jgi:putative phosphoesterase
LRTKKSYNHHFDFKGIKKIAIISDTHIGDRIFSLHPNLLPELVKQQVDLIVHAGDIGSSRVLSDLEKIAPVVAVRGNRDIQFSRKLPLITRIKTSEVTICITHGHGGFLHYIKDKWYHYRDGYQFDRYHQYLKTINNHAEITIFGHTHRPENFRTKEGLIFNPGSCSIKLTGMKYPTFGLIQINTDGTFHAQHVPLRGYVRYFGFWNKEIG